RLLTRDAFLGFQHASTCHFQGFVTGYQPPCIAEWRRGYPPTLPDTHRFTGCGAEDVQQFVSTRSGRGICRRKFGSSQHVSLLLQEARDFHTGGAAALTWINRPLRARDWRSTAWLRAIGDS